MFPLNLALKLPEWYKLERETEKTIGKLVNLKELDYYLRNSDEYLRRLVLIRLSELKPRDCENILRDILDDHSESDENKELAAWVLKATALKWNMEIFINNRYLTKFTGKEKLSDLYKITCSEIQPSIRFNFSSNKVYSQLPASVDTCKLEGHAVFDSGFDFKLWFSSITVNMLTGLKSYLQILLKLIGKAIRVLLRFIFLKLPVLILNGLKNIVKKKKQAPLEKNKLIKPDNSDYSNRLAGYAYNNKDLMPLVMKSRKPYAQYRPSVVSSLVSVVKKVVFNVLYVFFFPVRLFLKHKLALVFILLAAYVFLNFTNQGSILFKEYTGKEFLQFQTQVEKDIKEFSFSVWNGFRDFSGLNDPSKKDDKKIVINNDPGSSTTKYFSVTAEKGLNIRKAPNPTSEKITGGSLALGSTVTFLEKAMTDSSGRIWYYIKAEDGRSGWVSSKYLTVKKEG